MQFTAANRPSREISHKAINLRKIEMVRDGSAVGNSLIWRPRVRYGVIVT